jgi:hypothetical protein
VILRTIPTFTNYCADESGEIYSTCPQTTQRNNGKPLKLKQWPHQSNDGRKIVVLLNPIGKPKYIRRLVSRLVCEAFYGIAPEGDEASHLNGDHTDNRAKNLVWESHKENEARKWGHGTMVHGPSHKNSPLSEEDVYLICNLLRTTNIRIKEIADYFNVSDATVRNINNGKTNRMFTNATKENPIRLIAKRGRWARDDSRLEIVK